MSKGHRIEEVPELPLVVEDKVEGYKKTKEAVQLLKKLKAWNDIKKVYASQRMRAGKGKMRNRRRIQHRGPCIIYNEDNGIIKASETSLVLLCLISTLLSSSVFQPHPAIFMCPPLITRSCFWDKVLPNLHIVQDMLLYKIVFLLQPTCKMHTPLKVTLKNQRPSIVFVPFGFVTHWF
ncbi:60S ribosomal protein L4 [Cricetulus griseus]|uniref:60S ribosomal protein L4 n=1 Tax=Cricetulus griseus TaxID=10029 RepID=A0A061IIV5_CRIGR|nr:60S ribosomal protein L4 [Cricetulus griseus]